MQEKNDTLHCKKHLPELTIAVATALFSVSALAFDFNIDNPDLNVHWNNTVRLNLGYRIGEQDQAITHSPNSNDGDLNFGKGAMVTERLNLLSELQLDYRKKMGFRVSGSAWYDPAYNNLESNNNTPNTLVNGKPTAGALSPYTKRFAEGPSGQLLEAYAYRTFEFGQQKLTLSVGKSLQSWGNSLFAPLHGINYGQFPIDLGMMFGSPLSERTEILLPRNQVTADYVVSPTWSFGAEYFLDWQHARFPESGSYMGMYDLALDGGETVYLPNGKLATHGDDVTPNKVGDFGLNVKWSPDWLGGTMGLFFRRTADQLPDTVVFNQKTNQYAITYAGDIDIYGFSLSKDIAGVKIGLDLSYRRNMPLNSQQVLTVSPVKAGTPGFIGAMPQDGQTGGAIGNTFHTVLNGVSGIGKTPFFDSATVVAELAWDRVLSVTEGYAQYRGNPAYTGIDKSTRDFFGLNLNFMPTWDQVYPGIDLSMPLTYAVGLKGESAVPLGGNAHTGNYSIGLSAMVQSRYQIELKYTDFFGPFETTPGGTISSYAGLTSLLSDRETLWLTSRIKF